MSEPLVLVTQSGAVQTLALNRPAALNSLTAALHAQLLAALEATAAACDVRCVVITGMGRAFCAGQDLNDIAAAPASGSGDPAPAPGSAGAQAQDLGRVIETLYRPLCLRIRSMPVPVLAAVNGVAAGAGACLALGCDLVLAARSASFIMAFSKIGLLPDTGGTWLLPRLVGRAQALGLALLGDKLPAPEAERRGLIWRCVDDASLPDEALALAQRLAAMPVKALVATRQAMDAAAQLDYGQALAQEAAMQQTLGAGADYREGVAAFAGKRAPRFTER
ncbi:enoyl-CoA hydratase-related protein [Verminephrobacter eiseniae]|uniref:Enoyl-CoA hydratase/isomerase n=1 Tax=Verminephrobacter eiseniae (strain EF01-2) TaxID=391735 RepID=A1WPU2_VEREI|nr:enoyl-CoA hydratase-related protein [Verminephrobacter eiseniae]ABM59649.1 Enoyl-CoA hydratase/isomerase [Verminephrobacter eiseniae EF01-2]MCW5285165.1 2-(1,2-epoxy-1,2-dihydrophenyl)acetyl-CoA isomerase [Verminephrobacter eiseniae]MCW5302873.1 2-(1,2-epoxy-1,2-dihydrophenyl)acetyl-CoA isomerase [Verminephrobacter eiseniae]MCW8181014.1 2-(1,2-epoxy-1,2-dihydrophenyl)acetyl-CoA isomerase [Verminephrobacter eiseniae]MCW8192724.1 2-(1,2-epoxy-1,2-dihydrophenyl)acetyl-CoA isomerase [Verminephr